MTQPEPRHRGFNLAAWWSGEYSKPSLEESLAELRELGADSLAVVVTAYTPSIDSTTLSFDTPRTPTDKDLRRVFEVGTRLGFKVSLKPHLDVAVDPHVWRGEIGKVFETNEEWADWFGAYGQMIQRFAEVAEASGAALLCVGTELDGTVHREDEWRALIASVRERYSGKLVYAANHGNEEKVTWWDAVDYIGVDAYYPLVAEASATPESLSIAWKEPLTRLESLARLHRRKVMVMELGYRSVEGGLLKPWDFGREGPVDLAVQSLGYEVFFESVWTQPFLAGAYFWHWSPEAGGGGAEDNGYSVRDKPAGEVIRRWFLRGP